ncbi:MAG: DUF3618 domain-containing protein [Actinomycetota bacterium]|nr:DUF3618 domain-containing protein [Actinomycetota bacterium]
MGQTPEEIEKQIEQTREALGDKIDALTSQLSDTAYEVKTKGIKVLGVAFAAVVGLLTLKRLTRRKD